MFSPGVKRTEREANQSPPSTAKVKNTSTPLSLHRVRKDQFTILPCCKTTKTWISPFITKKISGLFQGQLPLTDLLPQYRRVLFCDSSFYDDSLLRTLSCRTEHSRLAVHHCRNSSVLSLLSALLALFRCACVSSYSILVQFL